MNGSAGNLGSEGSEGSESRLNQRYKILQVLGNGGFGQTFLAEDTHMPSQRKCVIKQLKPISDDPATYQMVQERFQREAAILEQLGEDHAQIPELYAYLEENDQFYLVEEWIQGITLTQACQQVPLTEPQVRDVLCQLLPVLDYIHQHQIVHRDIKPDNIILRLDGNQPVLIDFGAVKETMTTVMNAQAQHSRSIIIGTPGYMPAEQMVGRPTFSSDLYSLAMTAIYALTGRAPQEMASDPQGGCLQWQPHAPGVSAALAAVLTKATQLQLCDRFTSASEMLSALHNCPEMQEAHSSSETLTTAIPGAANAMAPTLVTQASTPVPTPPIHSPATPLYLYPSVSADHEASAWRRAIIFGGCIGGSILGGALLIRAELPKLLRTDEPDTVISEPIGSPSPSTASPSPDPRVVQRPPPLPQPQAVANANATVTGTRKSYKNVRSGPGTGYRRLGRVYSGGRVQVIGGGYDSDGTAWFKLYAPGVSTPGWMHSALIALDGNASVAMPPSPKPKVVSETPEPPQAPEHPAPSTAPKGNGTVIGQPGDKNIRSGPGTDYDVVAQIKTGQRLQVVGHDRDNEGYSWYEVYVPSTDSQGWIAAHLVIAD